MIPLPEDFYIRAQAMLQGDTRLLHAARRMRSWQSPDWIRYWHALGQSNLSLADKSVLNDDRVSLYKKAAALFSIACYPYLIPQKTDASYKGLQESFKKRCLAEGYPVQYRFHYFENHAIPYTFRKGNPRNHHGKCILFIRGLDSYKEVSYWDETSLLSQGYDIAAIDFPGMGENPVAMSPDSQDLFASLCQEIILDQHYDNSSIILWGLGFGGYWATKLLSQEFTLASINQGGPIHHSFKPRLKRLIFNFNEIRFLKSMLKHGLQNTMSMKDFIQSLSLLHQQTWRSGNAKLLYINGAQDKTVSDKEIEVLDETLEKDRLTTLFIHEAGHLAIDVFDSQVLPQTLTWLAQLKQSTQAA